MDYANCRFLIRCSGIVLPDSDFCLVHTGDEIRESFISNLGPGASIDLRGTKLNSEDLDLVLNKCRDEERIVRVGDVNFSLATFGPGANFDNVMFDGSATFQGCTFESGDSGFRFARFRENSSFYGAKFLAHAAFESAQFLDTSSFERAEIAYEAQFKDVLFTNIASFFSVKFGGVADFRDVRAVKDQTSDASYMAMINFAGAVFEGIAEFANAALEVHAICSGMTFRRSANFMNAKFSSADFTGTDFAGDVSFAGARFTESVQLDSIQVSGLARFGPMLVSNAVSFDYAVFESNPQIEVAAREFYLNYARFGSGGSIRLRYAEVMAEGATFEKPTVISFADYTFRVLINGVWIRIREGEHGFSSVRRCPEILSLRNSDTANLTISNADLSKCLFDGAHRLDQIVLDGIPVFGQTPRRTDGRSNSKIAVRRWSRRKTVFEEHLWRATTKRSRGWQQPAMHRLVVGGDGRLIQAKQPQDLIGTYRSLRRALENNKNEPGAADFYYGEMEMRRNSNETGRSERWILDLYWMFSGYGLRALRASVALIVLIFLMVTLIATLGIPDREGIQRVEATINSSQFSDPRKFDISVNPSEGGDTSSGSSSNRIGQSVQITLDAVLFRSSDAALTLIGSYLDIMARLIGPVFIALTLIAIRNRVKR